MTHPDIRKVAVLGAGTMGAQIAAHLVNARVPVLLFDLPADAGAKDGPKNGIALNAIAQLRKLSPAPLCNADDARYLTPANYDDDLGKLADCDLVIEAIAERLDLKHALYRKIAPHLRADAIFATNTSGLSIARLAEGFDAALQARFCGVHFFNPPRYLHLVELVPGAATRPELLDALETFLTSVLGKGVVRAKDTPNFVANRIGAFSMLATMAEADARGLRFDEVDDLTGTRIGRAKSATFRTADVVGLDTLAHVIRTLQTQLADDPFFALYRTPPALAALVERGALGQKRGAGFYRKTDGAIQVFDAQRGDYVGGGRKADEIVARILKRPSAERFRLLRDTPHPQTQFLWAIFRDVFHYAAVHLEQIADNARDLDFALRWGFGWREGPFETWQAAGWRQIAEWVRDDIDTGRALSRAPLPAWVFDGPVAARGGVHTEHGAWSPAAARFVPRGGLPVYARQAFRAPLAGGDGPDPQTSGRTLFEDAHARAWVDGRAGRDDVVIVSFRTKMNTLGARVLDALVRAIERAERDHAAVVIWQPASLVLGMPGGPFSAGANLEEALPALMQCGARGVEPHLRHFQQTMQRVKYARVPVVGAVSGLALGGGCELLLHCARRVAHVESHIGLVEAGIGVVPAGGGLKEAVLRAADAAQAVGAPPGDLLTFVRKPFEYAATAKVSGSAQEAQRLGYLAPSDPIVFNVYELLDVALREARTLAASGWRAPLRATGVPVAGRSACATLKASVANLRDGGYVSEHDALVANRIAEAICGGDVDAGCLVDEDWLLALERRAFIDLLDTPKTQARILSLLNGGKPLRN